MKVLIKSKSSKLHSGTQVRGFSSLMLALMLTGPLGYTESTREQIWWSLSIRSRWTDSIMSRFIMLLFILFFKQYFNCFVFHWVSNKALTVWEGQTRLFNPQPQILQTFPRQLRDINLSSGFCVCSMISVQWDMPYTDLAGHLYKLPKPLFTVQRRKASPGLSSSSTFHRRQGKRSQTWPQWRS